MLTSCKSAFQLPSRSRPHGWVKRGSNIQYATLDGSKSTARNTFRYPNRKAVQNIAIMSPRGTGVWHMTRTPLTGRMSMWRPIAMQPKASRHAFTPP